MRTTIITTACFLICGIPGCNAPAVNARFGQRQRLTGVSYAVAFDAARRALAERFHITDSDPEGGTIRAEQQNIRVDADRTGLLGDALGTPRPARRVAQVFLRRTEDAVELHCRVIVQENQADAVRLLTREHRAYDRPYDTPADRDAGTTRQQNAVWRDLNRDRSMERQILASVRELIDAAGRDGDEP